MNFLPLLIFSCCLKGKHLTLSRSRGQSDGLVTGVLPLAFIFGRAEKAGVLMSVACGGWWTFNFTTTFLPRMCSSAVSSSRHPGKVTTGTLHLAKECLSWLQRRDICSEEVDWYKDFCVHTGKRRTQKERPQEAKGEESRQEFSGWKDKKSSRLCNYVCILSLWEISGRWHENELEGSHQKPGCFHCQLMA